MSFPPLSVRTKGFPKPNTSSYKPQMHYLLKLIACNTYSRWQTVSCALGKCKTVPRLITASKSPEELYDVEDIFTPCWSIELTGRPRPCTLIPPLLFKELIFTRDPPRLAAFSWPPAFNDLESPPPPERLPPPMLPTVLGFRDPEPPICDAPTPKPKNEPPRLPRVLLPGDPPGPNPPIPFMLLLKEWLPAAIIPARLVIADCPWRPPWDDCCEPHSQ